MAEVLLSRRAVLGLGRPEREGLVLRALEHLPELEVVQTCLSGDEVLTVAAAERADVALVASDLYQLTDAVLERLGQTRAALVVLAADPDERRWRRLRRAIVLPLAAPPEVILAALRGQPPETPRPTQASGRRLEARRGAPAATNPPAGPRLESAEPTGQLLVVTKLFGSPGGTAIAINMAAAYGEGALLVELDPDQPRPRTLVAIHCATCTRWPQTCRGPTRPGRLPRRRVAGAVPPAPAPASGRRPPPGPAAGADRGVRHRPVRGRPRAFRPGGRRPRSRGTARWRS